MRTMTSREFNQDVGRAKRESEAGPVVITDRGRPAHVLMTYEAYRRLAGQPRIADLLGDPPGVEDVELVTIRSRDAARRASLD